MLTLWNRNDKLRRQHVVDELLNDLDLIEQFTCRMYQDMEVYNKEQTGFVVEIFKDIIKVTNQLVVSDTCQI
jgi:hypothetical protein